MSAASPLFISTTDPLAIAAVKAIQAGDVPALKRLLAEHSELARARIGDPRQARTLLHVAADSPGHLPSGAASIAALAAAGADVNARFLGWHAETPLHWASSNNDIAALDALLDAGADIEASGAVIGGGTPLADARGFAQWDAAQRLVERGAKTTLIDAATLGLMARLQSFFDADTPPTLEEINPAFWGACHGGQRDAAEFLLARGADLNWIPGWEALTPLDAACRQGANALVEWLRGQGAKSVSEVRG